MKCDSCIHNKVCKHKEEYAKLEVRLPITSEPFTVDISCLGYSSKPLSREGLQQATYQRALGTGMQVY